MFDKIHSSAKIYVPAGSGAAYKAAPYWSGYASMIVEESSSGPYTSTDYSQDGVVKTLQTATKGNGIDLVLMGDAYSDRLIADGTYDKTMNIAMEKFFAVEPYKSFRDHFNVYAVYNELYRYIRFFISSDWRC